VSRRSCLALLLPHCLAECSPRSDATAAVDAGVA